MNWTECQEFCQRLSEKMGMTVKLPTEAQWEYACRAGTTTALYNGKIRILGLNKAPTLSRIAWYGGNSSQNFNFPSHWDSSKWEETQYPGGPCGAHAVGKKKANAWGLYDMIGNVSEWCEDRWFQKYPPGSVTDPTGPDHGTVRVHRGGGWDSNAGTCRSAHRACAVESCRFCCVGFRLIAIEPQKSE